jgi:hypothetical protein
MPKKQSKDAQQPKSSNKDLVSFIPIIKNGWLIKFSLFDKTQVLIIFMSLYTHQVVIRFFDNEEHAANYINFVSSHDAHKQWIID